MAPKGLPRGLPGSLKRSESACEASRMLDSQPWLHIAALVPQCKRQNLHRPECEFPIHRKSLISLFGHKHAYFCSSLLSPEGRFPFLLARPIFWNPPYPFFLFFPCHPSLSQHNASPDALDQWPHPPAVPTTDASWPA